MSSFTNNYSSSSQAWRWWRTLNRRRQIIGSIVSPNYQTNVIAGGFSLTTGKGFICEYASVSWTSSTGAVSTFGATFGLIDALTTALPNPFFTELGGVALSPNGFQSICRQDAPMLFRQNIIVVPFSNDPGANGMFISYALSGYDIDLTSIPSG
jgi:hypothetical protein